MIITFEVLLIIMILCFGVNAVDKQVERPRALLFGILSAIFAALFVAMLAIASLT